MMFLVFLGAIMIAICSSFISGAIYMWTYELAFIPLINHLVGTAPVIPYLLFVLFALGVSILTPNSETKYEITDKKFWITWISKIIAKFMAISLLWVFNSFIV